MKIVKLILVAYFATLGTQVWAQNELSLRVDELFELIDQNNSSLRAKLTAVEAAKEGISVSKSHLLPDLDVSVSASYIGNIAIMDRNFSNVVWYEAPHYGNRFSIGVNQMIYTGGALTAGVRMAELQVDVSKQKLALTQQQLRFAAIGYYLDLYTLKNHQQVYEQNIALTERLIDDIKAKLEQGIVLSNDVTRYELQLANLQLGLRKLQDLVRVKNHELCSMLGLDEATLIVPVVESCNNSLDAVLLDDNPQLRLASLGVDLAEQGVKLAKSELLPKLNFFAVESLEGPITFEIPAIDSNLNTWYLGLGVSWNIASLYKSNHKVRKAKMELRESKEERAAVNEKVNNAVFEAQVSYEQSFVELATQTKNVKLAQENYEVVNERYINQLALITDMLDASNIKLNAELQEVDAQINIIFQLYRLKFATGTL